MTHHRRWSVVLAAVSAVALTTLMSCSRRHRDHPRPRDVVDLDPGHDAWTVGEESCVMLDTGVAAYTKPA